MQRVTISLPEALLKELEENATICGIPLAKYVRQLIEQNHQVEVQGEKFHALDEIAATKFLTRPDPSHWEHHLEWMVESRYLLRYLVDSLGHQSADKRATVLSAATERAQKFVAELLEKG